MHFKIRVIEIIKKIPYGKVTTYGTVAVLAGLPRGGRLVGGILHHCTEKENLPWQRVINQEGYISTRCLEHPKQAQRALLEEEGVEVSDDFVVDLKKYGWPSYADSRRSEPMASDEASEGKRGE